ncbi:hypothetical protein ACHQM5_011881 [Ranunculus cassubicifolius]
MEKNSVVPYLGMDVMFNIFTRLPAKKVRKLRYDCKEWYEIISSSRFVAKHLHHSDPCLLAILSIMTLPHNVGPYIDPVVIQIKETKVKMHTIRVKCRKFVEGSCNGLLLLEDVAGNLSVSNLVTGERLNLPPCIQREKSRALKRGITFVGSTREHKVVSAVFCKEGAVGFEVLTLGCGAWEWVSAPFLRLFSWSLPQDTFFSIRGVFHLMICGTYGPDNPRPSTHVASFDTADYKVYRSTLPYYWNIEALHDIDGYPTIVAPTKWNSQPCQWDVVSLKVLSEGNWEKQYSINLTLLGDMFPSDWYYYCVEATLENGRFLILKRNYCGKFVYHIYDVLLGRLRLLDLDPDLCYIFRPHTPSIVRCCLMQ